MKQIAVVFFCAMTCIAACGQNHSVSIDSLTSEHILLATKNQQRYFMDILENRMQIRWQARVDSLDYDYAFIEETFCSHDRTFTITERYFNKTDSIPKLVYINNISEDVGDIYDYMMNWYSENVTHYLTLEPLSENYCQLKAFQELPYDKRQVWEHGCVVIEDEDDYRKRRTKQLKTSYQIQTMVDRKKDEIIVSLQFPPKSPKFEVFSYNGAWDW
jgi:hypothetical protein